MPIEAKNIPGVGLRIDSVIPGSIADELEVVAGDRLLAVNGHHLRDLIDYTYYAASEEELLLEIEKSNGELWELEVERSEGESIGLIFPAPEPARCANNCLFCFVHQLPKGLRKPLYVKDEDYRLSFLNGNYVTLANLDNSDIERITTQRLSPLYISVHATNPELRERLLGKSKIPLILEQLQKLAAARIVMHTQIVLCPGLNDGDELLRTVSDLAALFPAVQSLAIVPLGLTSHRRNLPQLTPVDAGYARKFISIWQPQSEVLRRKLGQPFLFLADEFFLKADLPFPQIKEYGDFPQIENGVGMVPLFMKEAAQILRTAREIGKFRVTVVTGASSYRFVSDFLVKLGEKTSLDLVPQSVENLLFGPAVTVSGLVSGNDIVSALEGHKTGDALLVPDVMLKEGEGVFLDDVSIAEIELRIGSPVVLFDSTPRGFYRALKSLQKTIQKHGPVPVAKKRKSD
ncbi:MAG: FeS-binding protein [Geobacteraceae bacterium GWB2_52_12]|nr:MAG: FeS-binding protein [Geobacteraceae bacterium GWB2_52_12]